jgi:ribosomal protein RSM22 (predicted rRNA methylase)
MIKHWTPQELTALRRMRERFLNGTAGNADYWRVPADVALYDTTFAERIGWKWDAVLRELRLRGWQPRSRRVLDWGCGSGIAHRRVLAEWPQFAALALHDRSPIARRFAAERARADFPQVALEAREPICTPDTLLLVSHVINELPPAELECLLELARRAGEVIWVEAGTHADSRRLIDVRERLLESGADFQSASEHERRLQVCATFSVVAPCTHQRRCGMLTARNEPHWCHHFATPPSEIFQDARWAEFGKEMGIDLRSVPYSFLVLARTPASLPPGFSRIIGAPREAKGYARVLSCQAEGVAEFMLQKRDVPDLFKTMRKGALAPVYRWKLMDGKIVAAEELRVAPGEAMP